MSQVPFNLLQNLNPDAIIELYKLDFTELGGEVLYFHAGTNNLGQNLVWQGQEYVRYAIKVSGFVDSSGGANASPTLEVSNILSGVTNLVMDYDDLIGAVVTRKRTLKQFLDAENFVGGVNPSADPAVEYSDDIYTIERKISESRQQVSFELISKISMQGTLLPRRQIIQNSCQWGYRSSECGYAGANYFDLNDVAAADLAHDVCAKRLSSCKARFGDNAELPFGGFPGAGLISG